MTHGTVNRVNKRLESLKKEERQVIKATKMEGGGKTQSFFTTRQYLIAENNEPHSKNSPG